MTGGKDYGVTINYQQIDIEQASVTNTKSIKSI